MNCLFTCSYTVERYFSYLDRLGLEGLHADNWYGDFITTSDYHYMCTVAYSLCVLWL